MKKFIRSMAFAALVIAFNPLSAQEMMSEENPEVIRYAKLLDLNDSQQKELRTIYSDSEMKLKSSKDEMVKLRDVRTSEEKPVTADEKQAWAEKMDDSSKERRSIIEERNKRMLDILDKDQLAKYKEWREKKATEEPSEKMEKPSNKSEMLNQAPEKP